MKQRVRLSLLGLSLVALTAVGCGSSNCPPFRSHHFHSTGSKQHKDKVSGQGKCLPVPGRKQ